MFSAPAVFVLVFQVTALAAAQATPVDEALIARLEAAATPLEEQQTAREIRRRLGDAAISGELRDHLVRVLMSRESLAEQHIIGLLGELGAAHEFSENAIISLAGGLAGDVVHNWSGADGIASVLADYQKAHPLPEPAFTALQSALGHRAMLNRSAAIDALAAMPPTDDRHGQAVAAIVAALQGNEHEHTRSSAIAALGRATGGGPLPDDAIAALEAAALADPYMTVRIDALEVLVGQPLDAERKRVLSRALTEELIAPTPELWARSRGLRSHSGLEPRAIDLLARWFDRPYPPHVVDALIALTQKHDAQRSLALLAEVRASDGLSDRQRQTLEQIAASHPQADTRAAIYQLIAPASQPAGVDALETFEHDPDPGARVKAGYALQRRYADTAVPMQIAGAADRVMHESESHELRGIAAGLVARSREDFALREQRLLSGLAKHPDDHAVQLALVELYGRDRLEELVTRYGADQSVSVSFRALVIEKLANAAAPDRVLSPEAADALVQAAWSSSDYFLTATIERALRAWNIDLPLVIHFKKKENQGRALFALFALCTVLDLVGSLVGLISLFLVVLRGRARSLRRAGLLAGWLALSAGLSFLIVLGLIGFIGHNSAPPPRATLQLNLPLYAGTAIYLTLAWLVLRRARRDRRAGAAGLAPSG